MGPPDKAEPLVDFERWGCLLVGIQTTNASLAGEQRSFDHGSRGSLLVFVGQPVRRNKLEDPDFVPFCHLNLHYPKDRRILISLVNKSKWA